MKYLTRAVFERTNEWAKNCVYERIDMVVNMKREQLWIHLLIYMQCAHTFSPPLRFSDRYTHTHTKLGVAPIRPIFQHRQRHRNSTRSTLHFVHHVTANFVSVATDSPFWTSSPRYKNMYVKWCATVERIYICFSFRAVKSSTNGTVEMSISSDDK